MYNYCLNGLQLNNTPCSKPTDLAKNEVESFDSLSNEIQLKKYYSNFVEKFEDNEIDPNSYAADDDNAANDPNSPTYQQDLAFTYDIRNQADGIYGSARGTIEDLIQTISYYMEVVTINYERIQTKLIEALQQINIARLALNDLLTAYQTNQDNIEDIKNNCISIATEASDTIEYEYNNIIGDLQFTRNHIPDLKESRNFIIQKKNELSNMINGYSILGTGSKYPGLRDYLEDQINKINNKILILENKLAEIKLLEPKLYNYVTDAKEITENIKNVSGPPSQDQILQLQEQIEQQRIQIQQQQIEQEIKQEIKKQETQSQQEEIDSKFPPTNIIHWFDANDLSGKNGDTVTSWKDKISSISAFVSGNNALYPADYQGKYYFPNPPTLITNGLNNKPILKFTRDQEMQLNDGFQSDVYTLIFVARQNGGENKRVFVGSGNRAIGYYGGKKGIVYLDNGFQGDPNTSLLSDNYWDLMVLTRNAETKATISLNGKVLQEDVTGGAELSDFYINKGPGIELNSIDPGDSEIAEILMWKRVLTKKEIDNVQTYLLDKWNLETANKAIEAANKAAKEAEEKEKNKPKQENTFKIITEKISTQDFMSFLNNELITGFPNKYLIIVIVIIIIILLYFMLGGKKHEDDS